MICLEKHRTCFLSNPLVRFTTLWGRESCHDHRSPSKDRLQFTWQLLMKVSIFHMCAGHQYFFLCELLVVTFLQRSHDPLVPTECSVLRYFTMMFSKGISWCFALGIATKISLIITYNQVQGESISFLTTNSKTSQWLTILLIGMAINQRETVKKVK